MNSQFLFNRQSLSRPRQPRFISSNAIAFIITLTTVAASCFVNTDSAVAQDRDDRIRNRFNNDQLRRDPRTANRRPRSPVTIERFRTIDGSENNLVKTSWGMPGNHLRRIAPPVYADGIGKPAGADRKSPREISNLICDQTESIPNGRGMTSMSGNGASFWITILP